jgi:flagellar biosynthesis/type III secretory pathway chaperone
MIKSMTPDEQCEDQPEQSVGPLAESCLNHLNFEQELFERVLASLNQMETALVENNMVAVTTFLSEYQSLEQEVASTQKARNALRRDISVVLACKPESVSLLRFESLVGPPLSEQIRDARVHLMELTRNIETRNRCNGVLLRQSMQFIQHVLFCLTGQKEGPERYAASGQIGQVAALSTIQERC